MGRLLWGPALLPVGTLHAGGWGPVGGKERGMGCLVRGGVAQSCAQAAGSCWTRCVCVWVTPGDRFWVRAGPSWVPVPVPVPAASGTSLASWAQPHGSWEHPSPALKPKLSPPVRRRRARKEGCHGQAGLGPALRWGGRPGSPRRCEALCSAGGGRGRSVRCVPAPPRLCGSRAAWPSVPSAQHLASEFPR